MELTILMPCLNESKTIASCIKKAKNFIEKEKIIAEILVADNGSQDGSKEIAEKAGARVIVITTKGYGITLKQGIDAALGKYIIMADSDDSYDFSNLKPFLEKLREGYELIIGNRFKGGIEPGAMPWLHQYLGNPVLSGIGRLFFKSPVGDFHCGLRAFHHAAIQQLNLVSRGMEFASEMIIKATLYKLKITEVATILSKDGRNGASHLKTWSDGWRHLRFLLLFCPKWLFLYPGIMLISCGIFGVLSFHWNALYLGMTFMLGIQAIFLWLTSKIWAASQGIVPKSPFIKTFLELYSLEKGLCSGLLLLVLALVAFLFFSLAGSIVLLSVAIQISLYSFFITLLQRRAF